jgi:hypothetical protein
MMSHPLVNQLHFARNEFVRCLKGVSAEDAGKRVEPINCISWIIGHLAVHENVCWVDLAQDIIIHGDLTDLVGYGKPASTPHLDEMWSAWEAITSAADTYLDSLTPEILQTYFDIEGNRNSENIGTMLLRNIYHYWFHLGEAHAVRQMLGHEDLPVFVGDMSNAYYMPEQK